MSEKNQEIWKSLTEDKAYTGELPEIENEYDNEDIVTDKTVFEIVKEIPKQIFRAVTQIVAKPTSHPSSALTKKSEYQKEWKKIEQNGKLFIIFVMEKFDHDVKERKGAKQEAARLDYSMKRLGFETIVFKDQSKGNVADFLGEEGLGAMNLQHIEVFGMAISSHGNSENEICLRDRLVDLCFFVDPIKSIKGLIKKPKLFFVNACRGIEPGKKMLVSQSTDRPRLWPYHADCLIHFSTIEKTFSLRGEEIGGFFIVALCSVLDSLKADEKHDIHAVLAAVNYKVASLNPVNVIEADGKKHENVIQQPVFRSTLTSPVCLYPTKFPEKTTVANEY